jgi:hypothetical protein
MRIDLPKTAQTVLMGLALLVLAKTPVLAAASLKFDPAAVTVRKDNTLTATVKVDTAGAQVIGGDAVIRYSAGDLEFVRADNGGFFPAANFTSANDTSTGQVELHGVYPAATYNTGATGTFATITFKAKKDTGSGTLAFVCTGSGADTQFISDSGTNIIACSAINQLAITYTGGSASDPTPTPTLPVAATPTPTPAPGSPANRRPSCTGLSLLPAGAVTTVTGVTLTCAGNDPDGSIKAAEFFFGDGSASVTVDKGSSSQNNVSVKHTFAKSGTFSTACRVIDNSNEKSDMPVICSYNLTVSAAPAGSVAKLPTATPKPGTKPAVVTPEPTDPPPVATLAPYATPTPVDTASLAGTDTTPAQPPAQSSGPAWQILVVIALVGILVVIGLILLIRKLTEHHDQPPTLEPPMSGGTPISGGPPIAY